MNIGIVILTQKNGQCRSLTFTPDINKNNLFFFL